MAMARSLLRICACLWLFSTLVAGDPVRIEPSATAPFISDAEWGTGQGAGGARPPGSISAGSLASIGLSLLLVTGLAVGLGWVVRRTGLKKLLPGAGGHLQVVDRLALGRRRALLLVRCGDRLFLVGDHEHGLSGCGEMPVEGVSELVFSRQLAQAQRAVPPAPTGAPVP